jgi:hypothetical protein
MPTPRNQVKSAVLGCLAVVLATQLGCGDCLFENSARLIFEITGVSDPEMRPEAIRVGEAGAAQLVDIGLFCGSTHRSSIVCYDNLHKRNGTYEYEVVIASQTYSGTAVISGEVPSCGGGATVVTIEAQ